MARVGFNSSKEDNGNLGAIDMGQHRISVIYRKDSSSASGTDKDMY